ncbi:MAG: nucleotidyl transferase AbiEii/AbiGii toxin family protein, partial [Candidatus Micrarchaeota archaeon]|nr:nucleotidyl transferase AbiEii/AbiGii toxin family protein [Candidatus Micrarchaeota archaeon]
NSTLRDAIAIQGGGALHVAYGSQRFTNDLDFVWLGEPLSLELLLNLVDSDKLGHSISSRISKSDDRFVRATYSVNAEKGFISSFHLEGYAASPLFVCNSVQLSTGSSINVESPAEILLDKIVASLDRFEKRGAIKQTDIFDIHFILSLLKVQDFLLSDIVRKFASYAITIDESQLVGRLHTLIAYLSEKKESVAAVLSKNLDVSSAEEFDTLKMVTSTIVFLERLAQSK